MLHRAVWPAYLDRIDRRCLSQAEMQTLIVRRFIAAAAHHISTLANTTGSHIHCGSDCVFRTFRATHKRNSDPMVLVSIHVAKENWRMVNAIDNDIDLAIVK